MKQKILLKSFLLLALILTFSSPTLASEVTGTLSSSDNQTNNQTSGTVGGAVSGTVEGSSGGSSSLVSPSNSYGGRSSDQKAEEGAVLGTFTENEPTSLNNIAYGGTALQPSGSVVDPGDEYFPESFEVEARDGEVLGAEVTNPEVSTGFGLLFWIILILLVVAISRYVYNRSKIVPDRY